MAEPRTAAIVAASIVGQLTHPQPHREVLLDGVVGNWLLKPSSEGGIEVSGLGLHHRATLPHGSRSERRLTALIQDLAS
ncbi:hypothetical protein AB0K16_57330 [Nonomuraea jabiensis]|uniref:hypothetical protein n=1 Tax=Nonomuraea jabiensis TaxID=882448 RepID=UPI0034192EE3